MPGTKILNIQKSDSFEEVFAAFSNADAQEVIFIFPRGTVFAREAGYFEAIKGEAQRSGKQINIMTTDPLIANLASQQGIGLLQNPAPMADLTLARKFAPPKPTSPKRPMIAVTPSGRKIRDIVTDETDHEVSVQASETPEEHIEISRAPLIPKERSDRDRDKPDIERLWEEEEQRQAPPPPAPRAAGMRKRFILIPLLGALVILSVVLYSTVGNAKIIIKPQTQDLDFKLTVTASAVAETVSADLNRIPGQQFSVQKELSGSYPTTSQKEVVQKATGTATLYNTTSAPQRLVATTRLETHDGLIFRIPETITVPPATGLADKPGSIQSQVYADRPGKEYNIGPAEFTIPGFAGTPKFNQFSARSTAPMTGGIVGTAKVVAEQDFVKAVEELTAKAKGEVTKALEEQTGDLTVIQALDVTVGPPVVNAKVGEAAEALEMKLKGSLAVIAFREADVMELVSASLEKNGNWEPIAKELEIQYAVSAFDAAAKTLTFVVAVKGRAAVKLDRAKILTDVQGMDEAAIREYFGEKDEILSTRVLLSPFWVTRVPAKATNIELIVDTAR